MKKIALLFLLLSYQCVAQKEANIWYFGAQAGLDFNGGAPVALLNCSSSFSAFEGVGTLSDSSGSLLFYTDGNNVFNANHVTMPNGTGLYSNTSSTQTGLSVRQPGSDSLYYIFHIDLQFQITLYYSTVDMTLDGGLGDVVDKNVQLRINTTEKVTGVYHANGTDIWILTHDGNSDVFAAYLLTSTGLSAPVISNTGPVYSDVIGYLKASPQGDKLASADFYMHTYSLYDFDNSTGVVSNPSSSPATFVYPYGCEWSPDGTKLYGGEENSNDLWQFDVSAGANVWNTATLIYETASQELEALQLGPDGKIYASRYGTAWLGVINDPDSVGLACNYVDDGVDLLGRYCYLGLPNYNMSIFNPPSQVQPSFAASDTNVCEKFCVNFYDSSQNNPTSWQWIFLGGSPSSSTLQNPTSICYQNPGVFDVTLITTTANGNDTVTLPDYITVYATPSFPSITQAGYTLTSSNAGSYQWQFNSVDIPGATNQSYTVMQTGYYTVVISDENGCVNSLTVYVLISGTEEVMTAGNISIYPNPSTGNFVIEFSSAEALQNELLEIGIVNTLGQKVFSPAVSGTTGNSNNWKKEIEIIDASPGIYFIEIKTMNGFVRKKIVIAD